ncbi:MAG TPA: hypothetical protein VMJ10_08530 [Kofleriaceae bacterium]|nr:hypothetical protein [Kofleriaceae bacterium]
MKRCAAIVLIACGSNPPATPVTPPPSPPPVPPRPVDATPAPAIAIDAPAAACLPSGDARLVATGGALVLCVTPYGSTSDRERCATVTSAGIGAAIAPPPPSSPNPLASAAVRDEAGKLSACNASGCKPLGKALRAAIDAARKAAAANDPPRTIELAATDDLAIVALEGKPWRLAADRPLALVVPRSYAPPHTELGYYVDVIGTWLVSSWTTCAGPCEKSIVTDARGVHHGKLFDTGPLLRVDDRRVAVVSSQQELTITMLDYATGKQLGTLDLGAGEDFVHVARIDDHTFAFVAGTFDITWIDVSTDTPKLIAGPVAIAPCN